MKHDAITIFQKIANHGKSRQRRLTDLLRSPTESDSAWFMCVPPCFNAALDILQTLRIVGHRQTLTWTQGSNFSFAAGDSIYDTPIAYKDQWSDALQHIRYCIQVTRATAVTPAEHSTPRHPGSVTFDLLTPNSARTGLMTTATHTVTQDDLVQLLITGSCSQFTLTPRDTLL
jgi:hypothetical protein